MCSFNGDLMGIFSEVASCFFCAFWKVGCFLEKVEEKRLALVGVLFGGGVVCGGLGLDGSLEKGLLISGGRNGGKSVVVVVCVNLFLERDL